jgi:hypothetical protein
MRTDEEYAKNSINAYLKKKFDFVGSITEGENPPDYYVIEGDNKIALEITTAESISEGESKESRKRTSTEAVAKLCDQLNQEFKNDIPVGKSLMLVLKTPINHFSKFRKQVRLDLKDLLQENNFANMKLDIHGEIVELRWIDDESRNYKALIGVSGDKYPIINITEQTRLILEKIIKDKTSKLQKINGKAWHGKKWLGIINNYPLADHSNFSQALPKIPLRQEFSKIFLIGNNSTVIEIL